MRTYRYADTSEKDKILGLISATYNEEKSKKILAQWSWRYEQHPFRAEGFRPFFICEENGTIIGSSAFLPVLLKIGTKYLRGCNPIDTITHPKHRGVGIRLMKKLLKNEPLMIGVANVRTEQLWKRLFVGYQADISSLLLFSYPLKLGNIAHHLTGVGLAQHLPSLKNYYKIVRSRNKGLSFFKINGFGEDYDEFFNQACTDYEIIPVRNSQYLNWRFRDCPTERYDIFLAKKDEKIKGYTIIKLFHAEDGLKRSRVVEMFAEYNDEVTYNFMVDMAIQHAIEKEADLFQFIAPESLSTMTTAISNKKSFLEKKKVMSKIIGKCEGSGINNSFFFDSNNWHITYGDFDQDFL